MKRVLITGGAGYVGSELMSYLRHRDDVTAVLDIDISPAFNVCDERTLANVVPHYDTIVHLAAVVGEPACIIDPQLSWNINVGAVKKLVKHMSLSQRLIFMSTSSVYGNRPGETVDEKTTPLPNNHYARQKYEAEQIVQNNLRNYFIFRPVTAFGTTSRIRLDLLVNTLIYEALTTGEIKLYEPNIIRPMIHVTDFARFIIHAIDDKMRIGEIYNIGDPSMTMKKRELAHRIATLCDARVVGVEGQSLDLRDYNISFNKIAYIPVQYNISTTITAPYTISDPIMRSPLQFTKNPLELAVHQLKLRLGDITEDPTRYSTPERTRRLFERYKDVFN